MTAYPGSLDTTSTLPTGVVDTSVTLANHSAMHNVVNSAVIAIETALGTSPLGSSGYSTIGAYLANTLVQTPGASGQVVKPSADGIGLINRPFSDVQTHHVEEWQNAAGSSTVAYMDKVGNFSAASLSIAGTALASTNLSDTATLARLGAANVFTLAQTISAAAGLTLSGNGGATTLAITNTTAGVGLTIGADVAFTRTAAGVGEFPQLTNHKGALTSTKILGVFVTGDATQRAYFTADGVIHWTDGTSATDTNLYRVAASQLQTDYRFNAALDSYARVGLVSETKIGAFGPSNESALVLSNATTFTLYKSGSNAATTTGDINAANFNVTGAFKIAGTALASTNLTDSAALARLASPALSGTPTAPTPTALDSSTKVATTQYVDSAVAALSTFPSGAVVAHAGVTAPSGWDLADGNTLSRAGFATLFSAITFTQNITTANTSPNVVVTDSSNMFVGMKIEAVGIPTNTTISTVTDSTHIVISAAATASATVSGRLYLHGNGDGSTTFNKPDYRGRHLVGRGTHADVLTAGLNDGLSVASRTFKHFHGTGTLAASAHSVTNSLTLPNHIHSHTLTLPNHSHNDNINFTVIAQLKGTLDDSTGSSYLMFPFSGGHDADESTTKSGSVNGVTSFPSIVGAIGNPTTSPLITGTLSVAAHTFSGSVGTVTGGSETGAFAVTVWIIKL